ncbi:hypothetical protein P3X46_014629 [Hevea brasiliensis]|uniref:Autophagy-related protein n=1 Tax=Hevea brasiliensis TaxID=3981 RepID=A0ABQ9LV93_HEVBR|nr:hypothetical protein P3X46_014629 [Hevea brasiliensis]
MTKSCFKLEHDFFLEERRAEAARIREKYPGRIPFVYVIRKRIKLSAEKAIFIFVDNVLPPTGAVMSTIYDEKEDADGFLYVAYSGENTFGSRCCRSSSTFSAFHSL